MYEQNYGTTSQPAELTVVTRPLPPGPVLEGWLYRKGIMMYEKGWYKLEGGELYCTPATGDIAIRSCLGKVSGSVVTSEDRLEFTIHTEYKTKSFSFRAERVSEMASWMEACEASVDTSTR